MMKINANEFTEKFLSFAKMTFPDLYKDFIDGDELAIENMKYLNFGYSFKEGERYEIHKDFIDLQHFIQKKNGKTFFLGVDRDLSRFDGVWSGDDFIL